MQYNVWDDLRLIPTTAMFRDLMQLPQFREPVKRKLDEIERRQANRHASPERKLINSTSIMARKPYCEQNRYQREDRENINQINEPRPIYTSYVKLGRH